MKCLLVRTPHFQCSAIQQPIAPSFFIQNILELAKINPVHWLPTTQKSIINRFISSQPVGINLNLPIESYGTREFYISKNVQLLK